MLIICCDVDIKVDSGNKFKVSSCSDFILALSVNFSSFKTFFCKLTINFGILIFFKHDLSFSLFNKGSSYGIKSKSSSSSSSKKSSSLSNKSLLSLFSFSFSFFIFIFNLLGIFIALLFPLLFLFSSFGVTAPKERFEPDVSSTDPIEFILFATFKFIFKFNFGGITAFLLILLDKFDFSKLLLFMKFSE